MEVSATDWGAGGRAPPAAAAASARGRTAMPWRQVSSEHTLQLIDCWGLLFYLMSL